MNYSKPPIKCNRYLYRIISRMKAIYWISIYSFLRFVML
nr:MAG TPA: hypothetical protein [Caudoviricetes sp.]